MKKTFLAISILLSLSGCAKETGMQNNKIVQDENENFVKNQFQALWDEVSSDPLAKLPQEKISLSKLSTWGQNIILDDAKRTLSKHDDILEDFDKLAHPNGICFKGIWEIHTENQYSGYFKKDKKALIIARASTAMSNTRRGATRAFGFAGKLFPTTNPLEINKEHSANFFLIDDLGGTDAMHYTDVLLTNAPPLSTTAEVLSNILYGLKVSSSFLDADKNPNIRQLYEISQLKENKNRKIITPRWMSIKAQDNQSVDADDFRDELTLHGDKKLVFDILVASSTTQDKKDWHTIGTITLDSSIVSRSCDHRLHFHHPKWRDDLSFIR